jgi:hypothetical protein
MGSPRTQYAVSSSCTPPSVAFHPLVAVRAERVGEAWVCDVSVDDQGHRTKHMVTVEPADLARWAGGSDQANVEDLVTRSFDFLLEREPASSILATFDLSVIQRYFPEYDREFTRG